MVLRLGFARMHSTGSPAWNQQQNNCVMAGKDTAWWKFCIAWSSDGGLLLNLFPGKTGCQCGWVLVEHPFSLKSYTILVLAKVFFWACTIRPNKAETLHKVVIQRLYDVIAQRSQTQSDGKHPCRCCVMQESQKYCCGDSYVTQRSSQASCLGQNYCQHWILILCICLTLCGWRIHWSTTNKVAVKKTSGH